MRTLFWRPQLNWIEHLTAGDTATLQMQVLRRCYGSPTAVLTAGGVLTEIASTDRTGGQN
jgi:hypothetical protein